MLATFIPLSSKIYIWLHHKVKQSNIYIVPVTVSSKDQKPTIIVVSLALKDRQRLNPGAEEDRGKGRT